MMMLRSAPASAAPVKATTPAGTAVLRPIAARRRVSVHASDAGKDKKDEHHGLISVWEDKELAEGEVPQTAQLKVPPPPGEKHSLVSVWEDHELAEEEKAAKEAKEKSLLNKPTGKQQAASSYDSEW